MSNYFDTDSIRNDENFMKYLLDIFGKEKQQIMIIEEMAELTQAIVKSLRNKANRENIVEEIADVELSLNTLKLLFEIKEQELQSVKRYKIKRTLNSIYGKQNE